MKNLIIRRYKPGDEKHIIQLFEKVFKKPMGKTESIKHWNWEYKNNPNNRIEILLAIDENRIIGHYSVIPIKMKIIEDYYIASFSLDTMTHSEYRGQGIFPTLANKLYNDLGETGIPFTYGFPNNNSIKPFVKKCGWYEISNVPIYILPQNINKLAARYLKSEFFSNFIGGIFNFIFNLLWKEKNLPNRIVIEEINKFDKNFDDLWESVKDEIIISVVRNCEYLNWRYFRKPEDNYVVNAIYYNNNLKGYIVLKIEERFDLTIGLVVDIITDPSNIVYQHYLIKHAILYFKNNKVDIISVIMFPHWRYYKSLIRNKFVKIIKILFPEEVHFGVRKNSETIDFQSIKNPKNWYLTWGDTDVV